MTIKLNLGCGNVLLPNADGWVNIDINRPESVNGHTFWKYDLRQGMPLSNDSVDHIFASHVIEHFSVEEWRKVLPEWVRVLKPGGTMLLECPDIVRCCEYFAMDTLGKREGWWHMTIYGEPIVRDEDTGDKSMGRHLQGFWIGRLRKELQEQGMKITMARHWNNGTVRTFNIRVEAVKL